MKLPLLIVLTILARASTGEAATDNWTGLGSGPEWSDASNWSAGVPQSGDQVVFGPSPQVDVSQNTVTSVASLAFTEDAPAFTISLPFDRALTLTGTGITNSSSTLPTILVDGGAIRLRHGGNIYFINAATAGSVVLLNKGGQVNGANGGGVFFWDSATAGTASLTNGGGAAPGANGADLQFISDANAGTATITTQGGLAAEASGGLTVFLDQATAQAATLVINGPEAEGAFGGTIKFVDLSDGGTARAVINPGALLDISGLSDAGMGIGSIEGGGKIALGSKTLTVGGNDSSTSFSGTLQDGGAYGGSGGGLAKVGAGTLTLDGINTCSGLTQVNSGTLILSQVASLAGPATVAPNAILALYGTVGGGTQIKGTVVGNGTFAGAVTVQGGGTLNGAVSIGGNLSVQANGLVTLSDGALTANGVVTNDGTMRFRHGASLVANGGSFVNNNLLDVITGTFVPPANFTNNGVILDAKLVRIRELGRDGGGGVEICIDSYPMHTYQLQRSITPNRDSFADVGAPQNGATGVTLTFTDPEPLVPTGFYRIAVDP